LLPKTDKYNENLAEFQGKEPLKILKKDKRDTEREKVWLIQNYLHTLTLRTYLTLTLVKEV
jgi:hypothetical protein